MSNVVARDVQAFAKTRAALNELIACGDRGATGVALFGEAFQSGRWAYMLMRRLRDRGLVAATQVPGQRSYVFVAQGGLSELVASDQDLTALLWPGGAVHAEPLPADQLDLLAAHETLLHSGDVPHADAATSDSDDADTAEAGADRALPELDADDAAPEDILRALLKLQMATLENMIHIRERVDALATEMTELKRSWQ